MNFTNSALIPALLTAAVATVIALLLHRQKQATLLERLRLREEESTRTTQELTTIRQSESELRTQLAKIETALTAEREAHERLSNEFKALSAEALSKNNDQFLKLARESFSKLHQQSSDDLGKRQQAIDSLVKPLKESLQNVQAKIGEIEKSRADAYGRLSEQLK